MGSSNTASKASGNQCEFRTCKSNNSVLFILSIHGAYLQYILDFIVIFYAWFCGGVRWFFSLSLFGMIIFLCRSTLVVADRAFHGMRFSHPFPSSRPDLIPIFMIPIRTRNYLNCRHWTRASPEAQRARADTVQARVRAHDHVRMNGSPVDNSSVRMDVVSLHFEITAYILKWLRRVIVCVCACMQRSFQTQES